MPVSVRGGSYRARMTASVDPAPGPDGPHRPGRTRLLRESVADRLPPVLRGGALDPAVRGAFGLAAVALIAALVAGCYAWQARPRAVALPPAAGSVAPASQSPPAARPAADPVDPRGGRAAAIGAGQPAEVVVHVAGKVHRPGVVTLPSTARVDDAVVAAGGALPGTDLSTVDLARHVVDGEQILVGVPGAPAAMSAAPPAAVSGQGTSSTGQPATGGGPAVPLDLNTSGPEQLDGLPGVGPVLAQRIIAWRTEHGGFRSVDELREVKGLGGKKFDDIAPLVRV